MARIRHHPRASLLLVAAAAVALAGGCNRQVGAGTGSTSGSTFAFTRKPSAGIVFLSTQMNPVEEAARMRNSILKDFPGEVDFRPNDDSHIFSQVDVLLRDSPSASILVGALHSEFARLWEDGKLAPMDGVMAGLAGRGFPENLKSLGKFDGKTVGYIPWMQASYVMVANRKALAWLPEGASTESLTWDQYLQWGKNILAKTGKRGLGFPAGTKGLMHRFFQGYLYPSFTGSTLLRFRTREAAGMWEYFRELWNCVNLASLSYSTMADPLLAGDVMVAWDHTARLTKAIEQRPGDFIAFPAPRGPKGRGFIPVVSGLAVPAGCVSDEDQAALIDYLTQPVIQDRTLAETGFFPVLERNAGAASGLPPGMAGMRDAVERQTADPDSIPVLIPVGLGNRNEDFNTLYMLTFAAIVLEGRDAAETLDRNAALLQRILDEQDAKWWLPDVSDRRPCKIE